VQQLMPSVSLICVGLFSATTAHMWRNSTSSTAVPCGGSREWGNHTGTTDNRADASSRPKGSTTSCGNFHRPDSCHAWARVNGFRESIARKIASQNQMVLNSAKSPSLRIGAVGGYLGGRLTDRTAITFVVSGYAFGKREYGSQ
jgi:hypothetical protein